MQTLKQDLISFNIDPVKVCPHCEFIQKVFCTGSYDSKREYWLMTEVFMHLHNGKDHCDYIKS